MPGQHKTTPQADRHREKPLSLRLGPLREQAERRAADLGVPVRRFILGAIKRELDRLDKEQGQ